MHEALKSFACLLSTPSPASKIQVADLLRCPLAHGRCLQVYSQTKGPQPLCQKAATHQEVDDREDLQQKSSRHIGKEARDARSERGLIMNESSWGRNGCSGRGRCFCPKVRWQNHFFVCRASFYWRTRGNSKTVRSPKRMIRDPIRLQSFGCVGSRPSESDLIRR